MMRRLLKHSWVAIVLIFTACAGVIPSNPQNSLGQGLGVDFYSSPKQFATGKAPLSSAAVLTFPPFVRQESKQLCGLAAAKMIAGYYHQPLKKGPLLSLKEITRRMHGISGQELKNIFEDSNYWAAVFPGQLNHSKAGLFNEIDSGHPLIVMLKKRKESHYLLVNGYDPKNKLIILDDPAQGPVALSMKRFQSDWEGSGRFTLLAVPGTDLDKK